MTTTAMASRPAHKARSIAIGVLLTSLAFGPAAARAQTPAPPPETPPPGAVPPAGEVPPPPPPSDMALPPPPVEAPPPAPMPPPPPLAPMETSAPAAAPSKIPSYLLWGVGGASLVVGAVFGFAALSAKSDFDDMPTNSKADDVSKRATYADVGLGLGVILVVTGTIFYLVDDTTAEASRQATTSPTKPRSVAHVRVDPLITPTAGGGVVTLRF